MRFVKANGLVIHYLDQGRRAGPPLVFINSLGTDFRIWNEVAEILAPDFRIVTYDKRGHGLSESGPDKNDMADYARDLAALLDQVGVGRATIVGLSIGGLIAQELYRQSPERVAALVLCDTAAKIGTDEVWDQQSLKSSAAASNPWPIPSSNGGSPPISDPGDPPRLPAYAPCSRGRLARAILPPAGP
jgi:3-oxoadipate enol-lactonase